MWPFSPEPAPKAARAAHLLGPALVVVLLAPHALRQNAWREWANALWLIEQQQQSIATLGRPSLFISADFAALYPHHAFYGGSLFAVAGTLALLLGSAWSAYLLILGGSLLVGYGAGWWMGRLGGLSRAWAHAPALVFVAAPYTTSKIYGGCAFA